MAKGALSFEEIVAESKRLNAKAHNKTNTVKNLEGNSKTLKNSGWYNAYTKTKEAYNRNKVKFVNPMSQRDRPDAETIEIDKPLNGTWANKKGRWNTVSSAIKSLEYDPMTKNVTIQFQNNKKKYDYPDVPIQDVVKWAKSSSKGRAYNKLIKKYSVNQK